jgi:hypothetical protein
MDCAREIYRNCARLLLAADLVMEDRSFSRYGWDHVYDGVPVDHHWRGRILDLTGAEAVLGGYLFHQYFADGQKDKDIVTICTAPQRYWKAAAFSPVCCASRFSAQSTPNEVYWIGTIPIWEEKNATDGKLYYYDVDREIWPEYPKHYEKVVQPGSKVTTISVPLAEVTSSAILEAQVIRPLLGL